MTRVAALDINETNAHFVVVDQTLRRTTMVTAESLKRGDDEDLPDFWNRVRGAMPGAVETLVCSADSKKIATRLIHFPFGDQRKVELALEFELDGQIPYDIEDVNVAWCRVDHSRTSTDVLTGLTPKVAFTQWLDALEEADFNPKCIVPPASSLSELIVSRTPEPIAVLSLGSSESHLAVRGSGGELAYARSIHYGGKRLESFLCQELKVSREELQRFYNGGDEWASGVPINQLPNFKTAFRRALEPLLSDLAATFKVLPPHFAPRHLLVTGSASRWDGLSEEIRSHLDLDVQHLNVVESFEKVEIGLPLGPEFAVSVGMMLSYLRKGRNQPLNLRHKEFSYTGELSLYRGEGIRLGVGFAVLFLLAVVGNIGEYYAASSVEQEVNAGFCKATKQIVGREICSPEAALSIVRDPGGVDSSLEMARPGR
ncbi:MAG TPA: hypothetical protein EYN91_13740 [Candidatus Melainabacteria bacterium]|nr:hypothetical protein [Candidatus Melainabacteria bacterium]